MWSRLHPCRSCRGLRRLGGLAGAPTQVAEEIKRFGAMQPHPQSVGQVLTCTDSIQLLEFLKEERFSTLPNKNPQKAEWEQIDNAR